METSEGRSESQPIPEGERDAQQLCWHYTTGQTYREIELDGFMKAATTGIDPGERPIVWVSENGFREPTTAQATLRAGLTILLSMDQMCEIAGLARIGVSKSGGTIRLEATEGIERDVIAYCEPLAFISRETWCAST